MTSKLSNSESSMLVSTVAIYIISPEKAQRMHNMVIEKIIPNPLDLMMKPRRDKFSDKFIEITRAILAEILKTYEKFGEVNYNYLDALMANNNENEYVRDFLRGEAKAAYRNKKNAELHSPCPTCGHIK